MTFLTTGEFQPAQGDPPLPLSALQDHQDHHLPRLNSAYLLINKRLLGTSSSNALFLVDILMRVSAYDGKVHIRRLHNALRGVLVSVGSLNIFQISNHLPQ